MKKSVCLGVIGVLFIILVISLAVSEEDSISKSSKPWYCSLSDIFSGCKDSSSSSSCEGCCESTCTLVSTSQPLSSETSASSSESSAVSTTDTTSSDSSNQPPAAIVTKPDCSCCEYPYNYFSSVLKTQMQNKYDIALVKNLMNEIAVCLDSKLNDVQYIECAEKIMLPPASGVHSPAQMTPGDIAETLEGTISILDSVNYGFDLNREWDKFNKWQEEIAKKSKCPDKFPLVDLASPIGKNLLDFYTRGKDGLWIKDRNNLKNAFKKFEELVIELDKAQISLDNAFMLLKSGAEGGKLSKIKKCIPDKVFNAVGWKDYDSLLRGYNPDIQPPKPWKAEEGLKIQLKLYVGQKAIVPIEINNPGSESKKEYFVDTKELKRLSPSGLKNSRIFYLNGGEKQLVTLEIQPNNVVPGQTYSGTLVINSWSGGKKKSISIKIEVKILFPFDKVKDPCCPDPSCQNTPDFYPVQDGTAIYVSPDKSGNFEIELPAWEVNNKNGKDKKLGFVVFKSPKSLIISRSDELYFTLKPNEKRKMRFYVNGYIPNGDKEGLVSIVLGEQTGNIDPKTGASSVYVIQQKVYHIIYKKDTKGNCLIILNPGNIPGSADCELEDEPDLKTILSDKVSVQRPSEKQEIVVVPEKTPSVVKPSVQKQINYFLASTNLKHYSGGEGVSENNRGFETVSIGFFIERDKFKEALKLSPGKEFYQAILNAQKKIEITTIYSGISKNRLINSFSDNVNIIKSAINGVYLPYNSMFDKELEASQSIYNHNVQNLVPVNDQDVNEIKNLMDTVFADFNANLPVGTKLTIEFDGPCGTKITVTFPDGKVLYDGLVVNEAQKAALKKMFVDGLLIKDSSVYGLRVNSPDTDPKKPIPSNIESTIDRLYRFYNPKTGDPQKIKNLNS